MRILTLTDPSSPERENEDALVLGPDLAVVVDGAGLDKSQRQGCHHSVAWYSHLLAACYARRLVGELDMRGALAGAIGEVRDAHSGTCDLAGGSPSATVAAWRMRGGSLEHLVLCDAAIMLRDAQGDQLITDLRVQDAVASARWQQERDAAGARGGVSSTDVPLPFQNLEASRNVEGGFWCAHHQPEAADHALVGETPWEAGMTVIAMSDGAARALLEVRTHTEAEFLDLCAQGRLVEICESVRSAEDAAASRFRKVHDDLTIAVGTD